MPSGYNKIEINKGWIKEVAIQKQIIIENIG